MKLRNILKITLVILALATFATAASANDEETAAVNVSIRAQVNASSTASSTLERLRENAEKNKNNRNDQVSIIKQKIVAGTSTKDVNMAQRQEKKLRMRIEEFIDRRNHIVKELLQAVKNLENIATRSGKRIAKLKTEGKNTASVEAQLATATTKINKAKVDIAALANWTPTATSTVTSSSTVEVSLEKPRAAAELASKDVKDARNALKDVVRSIAHLQGNKDFKFDDEKGDDHHNGTSTPPITATSTATTTTTASTTATTTP